MSAPFHDTGARQTPQGLRRHGLDASVARCDGALRENACAARCLHAAQSAVPRRLRGALRAAAAGAAGMCGGVGLKE